MTKAGLPAVWAWLMGRFTREDPADLWRALRLGPERAGPAFYRGAHVIGAMVTTAYLALSLVLLGSIPRDDGNAIYFPAVLIFLLLMGVMASLQIMVDVDGPSQARRLSVLAVWLGVILAGSAVVLFDW